MVYSDLLLYDQTALKCDNIIPLIPTFRLPELYLWMMLD